MAKKNVAIVMGGYSAEYKISLQSGAEVYKHIDLEKYNAYRVHITKEGWFGLDEDENKHPIDKNDFSIRMQSNTIIFDVVWNAIHGSPGEDGKLQAYFDLIGLPQTSCDSYPAALTFNKRDCISALKPYGIATASNFFLTKGDVVHPQAIVQAVGLPCFVKANKSGSSYGVSKVVLLEQLQPAIDVAYKEDDEILIESFLDGTEVSVGIIPFEGETWVLPITEIVSENDFFDYEAKYMGMSKEITPARLTDAETKKVKNLALKVHKALRIRGFSRSEYIFHQGEPHFIEMNTVPGFTSGSILPKQVIANGISIQKLITNTIEQTQKDFKKF